MEEVAFESEDGITLAGWFTPPQNNATIILLHGYGGNRTAMIWRAQQLVNAGYGVLMYDERASGESAGEYRSYGWEDTRDVKAAIQFLESRNTGENIGAMGCSTGASIVVYSAALYPEVDAVWGDGNSSGSEGELYTYRFAELAGPNAQAWVIPEATHCDGPFQRPEEYSQRMVEFFDEAFGIVR